MNKIIHLPHHLSECNYPVEYDRSTQNEKEALQNWINNRVKPHLIKSYNPSLTSYGLKHYFEKEVGIYVTNGAFKGAMLEAQILPKDYKELNWVFKISKRFYK